MINIERILQERYPDFESGLILYLLNEKLSPSLEFEKPIKEAMKEINEECIEFLQTKEGVSALYIVLDKLTNVLQNKITKYYEQFVTTELERMGGLRKAGVIPGEDCEESEKEFRGTFDDGGFISEESFWEDKDMRNAEDEFELEDSEGIRDSPRTDRDNDVSISSSSNATARREQLRNLINRAKASIGSVQE